MIELTEPIPNLPLLRKCVEWAELEATKPKLQREWDQAEWVVPAAERTEEYGVECGTAYCLAGYVVHLTSGVRGYAYTLDGALINDAARDELGLTDSEARSLFSGTNDINDIREKAERIATRAGERL